MTNAEKFKEVFGFDPDTSICIRDDCPDKYADCEWYNRFRGMCQCDEWWGEEFKEVIWA